MSKPFDATSKDLIEAGAADWVAYLGRPTDPARVSVIDADLSTVTAEADKVVRVADPDPWVLHLEFQSSAETGLPRRLLRYNAMLQDRHACPVATAVFLLRKEANASDVTGDYTVAAPVGPTWAFRYTAVRVWQLPAEPLLTGGLGLMPFAPIADVPEAELPRLVARMKDRIGREAPLPLQRKLWGATGILLGLKYEETVADVLLEGVLRMEESSTYQALLRRGRAEGRRDMARELVLELGAVRFGPPPADVADAVNAIADVDRLKRLAREAENPAVTTWHDLLATN